MDGWDDEKWIGVNGWMNRRNEEMIRTHGFMDFGDCCMKLSELMTIERLFILVIS